MAGRPHGRSESGFTLVEILVVIAIISLGAALVIPSLGRIVDAVQRDGDLQDAVDQVRTLSFAAYSKGQGFVLADDAKSPLALPSGWRYVVERPIHFNAMGMCDGGVVILTNADDRQTRLRLSAPDCAVSVDTRG
jgi:prepilin-type N-terminal cleavage/methylation domain-containing protein